MGRHVRCIIQGILLIIVILMKVMLPILLLLFAIPVYAETSGNITLDLGNVSVTTGITGYTVNLCNATSDCLGITCFLDYDNFSLASSKGWCNFTALTHCQHNGSAYATGTTICTSNESYRTCSSGVWSANTACSSGQTCNNQIDEIGACVAPDSSNPSGSTTTMTSTASITPAIIFTTFPGDFNITQGTSVSKTIYYKNSGNQTLYDLVISVSDISWYSVSPSKIDRSYQRNEGSFTIAFSPTDSTELKTYDLTVTLTTNNATTSHALKVTVLASEKTIQEEIIPSFADYSDLIAELWNNVTYLETQGYDVEEIKSLLVTAERKMVETNSSLEQKDYTTAAQLLADVKGTLDSALAKIDTLEKSPFKLDLITVIIIVAAIAVVAVVIYLFLPSSKKSKFNVSFRPTKGFGVIEKLKRKK